MGSYTQCMIDTDATDIDEQIIACANNMKDFKDGTKFQEWCWRRMSPETKWYGYGFATELSKKFPSHVFRLTITGDYNFCSYLLNGECLDYKDIYEKPQYPSASLFKKKLKEKKIKVSQAEVAKRVADAEKAKAKAAAELAALEARKQELSKILEA